MNKRQIKQKGIIFLDLVLGLAIASTVVGGIVGVIHYQVTTTETTKTVITTTHEITNAARCISNDAMMAENTDLVEDSEPVNQVTLSWVERFDFVNIPHTSSYYLNGTELQRNYDGTVTTIARGISEIEYSQTDNLLTVSITCTSPWRVTNPAVTQTYRVCLRTAEEV